MHAREIYERIQRNALELSIAEERAIDEAVDHVVGELCKCRDTGPHAFSTDIFRARTEGIAEALAARGLRIEVARPHASACRHLYVTVPEPKAEETNDDPSRL